MNVLSPLWVLSDSLWAGKLRLAQWEGAKAAVDRRETRRGLTAAKNSRDNFSLRPSVVQQPETFAKNYNFANASLLRNLIFRCSFHLNEPPPWKLAQHEILIEVLVDEGSARVVVESSRIIPLMSTTPHKILGASGHLRSDKTSSVVKGNASSVVKGNASSVMNHFKGLNSVFCTL